MVGRDYTVRLDRVFQGPLDLLLHLVREQEVEIHEIEISRVITGYLAYMKDLENLDIELAGEFVVMAATLMAIKSRSLLPRDEVDLEDDLDPKDELIQRLIQYRRFKEASDGLGERFAERVQLHPRGAHGELDDDHPQPTLDLGELTSWDLLSAFSRLMRETMAGRPHRIRSDPRPMRFYVERMADAIRAHQRRTLAQIVALDEHPSRETMIGSFCALLELVRMGLVGIEQPEQGGEIEIRMRAEHADDMDAVLAGSTLDDELASAAEGEAAENGDAEDAGNAELPDNAETSRAQRASDDPGR